MVKKILSYLGQYKKYMVLTPLFVFAEVILEVLIPFLMAGIIDTGVENKDLDYIVRVGIAMLLMSVISLVFGALSGAFSARGGAGMAKNLRKGMYDNIQNFSFANIDKYSTASLLTRLTTDVMFVQQVVQMGFRLLVRAPTMLIASTIMAIVLQPGLATVFLVAIPFLGAGIVIVIAKAHKYFVVRIKKYDVMNTVIQENLTGIKVVKSYVKEDAEKAKFDAAANDLINTSKRAERIVSFNLPIMQTAIYGCMVAILWFGGNKIIAGTMTTGQLTVFLSYVMQILMSLMLLATVFVMLLISKVSAARIVEVLEEQSSIVSPADPVTEVTDGAIEFRQVSFAYGERKALQNINLVIGSGETVGILGGTGSSKSTLVQLIPRLYDVTEGECLVGGVDVRDYDLQTLRDSVSMVLQKNVLFSGTIAENLRWGKENATDEEIVAAAKLAQAHDFVMGLPDAYNTVVHQGGANLSGGQRQRLCIARALLKNPKIIILDDSTSAVDTKTDALIREALSSKVQGLTKIIIAQRIQSIENADKIIVMAEGGIEAVGTHQELLGSNETYQDIYYTQTAQKGTEADND